MGRGLHPLMGERHNHTAGEHVRWETVVWLVGEETICSNATGHQKVKGSVAQAGNTIIGLDIPYQLCVLWSFQIPSVLCILLINTLEASDRNLLQQQHETTLYS